MKKQNIILHHFKQNDPIMHELCHRIGLVAMGKSKNTQQYFTDLCETIVNQQLSNKAGATIFKRLLDFFNNHIEPRSLLSSSDEALRSVGISYRKANYLKNLAKAFIEQPATFDTLSIRSDQEVITTLASIKGIGQWSAEMFLMFSLCREDIFSCGDLGLRKAIMRAYNIKNLTSQQLQQLSQQWSPYRTYAARVLWKSLEQ